MSERSTHNCETCPHVATRHFYYWCAWLQPPIGTRGFDDGASGAVLHAAAWLHELRLGKNSAGSSPDSGQYQYRCSTNEAGGAPSDASRIFHRHSVAKTVTTIMIWDDYDRNRP